MTVEWVLGIDPGKYKTGVAVGQTLTASARPIGILQVKLECLLPSLFEEYMTQWKPSAIVVGMPTLADGTEHPLYQGINQFMDRMKAYFCMPVYAHNEFLSSHEARNRNRKKKHIDDIAAAVILESWLGSQSDG